MSTDNADRTREALLEERLEYLRTMLPYTMAALRNERDLTQAELADRVGLNQPAISKIESDQIESDWKTIVRYLNALDADLVLAVRKREGGLVQVTDEFDYMLVEVKRSVAESVAETHEQLNDCVQAALAHSAHNPSLETSPPPAVTERRWADEDEPMSEGLMELSNGHNSAELAEDYDTHSFHQKSASKVVSLNKWRHCESTRVFK